MQLPKTWFVDSLCDVRKKMRCAGWVCYFWCVSSFATTQRAGKGLVTTVPTVALMKKAQVKIPLVSCSWSVAWFVVCHFVSLVSSKCVYYFQRRPILCIFLHTCTDFNHPGSGNMLSGRSDGCVTWWPPSTVRNHAIRPKNDSQKAVKQCLYIGMPRHKLTWEIQWFQCKVKH